MTTGSKGHASMLLWAVLHRTETQAVSADYETLGHPSVSLEEIRHFRQLDSKAPGHPEYRWVSRVASAPLKALQKKFGFEPDHVVAAAKDLLDRR